MSSQQMRPFDGFADAEREAMLYSYYWAASEVGGHFPPVRSLARIFVRRRVQVFVSDAGPAHGGALVIDPRLTAGTRLGRVRSLIARLGRP